jgi:hypothetical protein
MRALQYQRNEGQNPAFATVVRAHNECDVFHADDTDQRPQNQREDTVDVLLVGSETVFRFEALAQRVKRAGTDVAIDDTER